MQSTQISLNQKPQFSPERSDLGDWSKHWSAENQGTIPQKFFSIYRKAVFARSVQYFVNQYFPHAGRFVEAGSGTAETSISIDKAGGAMTLVAVDIVQPVLRNCQPCMDARVCGDIFCLPFQDNSLDGIWNVGVMEHFTQDQIDMIMRECWRVLKSGSRIILFWPAVDSVPQKLLRLVESIVNLRSRKEPYRFHPAEISQLRSTQEGHAVLNRNGFKTINIDDGLRTLLAFKILVGAKE